MSRRPPTRNRAIPRYWPVLIVLTLLHSTSVAAALVSAILPTSRSALVATPVTVFATVLNPASEAATNCRPALGSAVDVSLVFQTTDSATNAPTGTPQTPVTLQANGSQSFVLQLTANAPFVPTDVVVDFLCDNADTPNPLPGINTLLMGAETNATADIVALAATIGGTGSADTNIGAATAFSVASANVGAPATITVTPSITGTTLDQLSICQTDPVTAQCLSPPGAAVTLSVATDATPTFSVFFQHNAEIAFRPDLNRVQVTFAESGVTRGRTSVALRVASAAPEEVRPNILLVISDDQGLDASAQYPLTNNPPNTPVLDELANQGITYDNAWVTPSCTTTRASVLTGLHGVNSGITSTPGRIEPGTDILQSRVATSTDYATAVFGKWHVGGGGVEATHPNELGVGHYAGNLVGNIASYTGWDLTINGATEFVSDYHTSKITDLALNWISEQSGPWFAWVAYSAPHSPFHLPPADLQSSGLSGDASDLEANTRAYYLAAIEALDTELGRLLDSMPAAERDNTLIIFMGDNGTPRTVIDTSVFPRNHGKSSLYEGGVGAPLLVSGAAVSRAGARDPALINATDLFATILELTGSDTTPPANSQSFAATFTSANATPRERNYIEIEGSNTTGWATRNADYKLLVFSDGSEELYRLSTDPDEQDNLLPGDSATTQIRNELYNYGRLIRGETTSTTAIDITNALLENRSTNCADYVQSYRSDALDVNSNVMFEGSLVISVIDDKCVFTTNMIPNHDFNDGANSFPNAVAEQAEVYSVTTSPSPAAVITPLALGADNALLLNGVKVDLLAAGCFGVGDGRVGCNDINQLWRYDPMFTDNGFRVDSHNAHTQSNGAYHYHGPPNALYSETGNNPSPVVGFAADGYPIYGSFFAANDATGTAIRAAESSYQLRSGSRPDGAGDPGGQYDGAFRDDYEYVPGAGDLDECNGMTLEGSYGYYITQRFPYVVGCLRGTPDSSFNK